MFLTWQETDLKKIIKKMFTILPSASDTQSSHIMSFVNWITLKSLRVIEQFVFLHLLKHCEIHYCTQIQEWGKFLSCQFIRCIGLLQYSYLCSDIVVKPIDLMYVETVFEPATLHNTVVQAIIKLLDLYIFWQHFLLMWYRL